MTVLRSMLLLVTAVLLACHGNARDAAVQDSLSVVTLNLWHDKGDWPRRQALIVQTLRAFQPDVIALQEVLQDAQLPNQAQSLADALGYRYVFVSVDAPAAVRRYGNAILTRHPILTDDSTLLAPMDDYRSLAHVRLAIGPRRLDVYATHLHHTPEGGAIRRWQVDVLVAAMQRTRSADAALVLGDFNTASDTAELAPLRALGFRDAYTEMHPDADAHDPAHSTLNLVMHPPSRIDHVFFAHSAFVATQAQRLFDTPAADGTWASDHFGLHATLRFRDSR